MKIAILGSQPVPYAFGGMDRFYQGLLAALRVRNPDTDLILVPVDERNWEGVLDGYRAFYHLDLSRYDAVISTKGPSYMVRHPCHISYLSHRIRAFYDLYERGGFTKWKQRRLIQRLDRRALADRHTRCRFVIGQTVAEGLRRWGNHSSRTLRLPSTLSSLQPGPYEYFLSVGRLHHLKRVHLAIEAIRLLPPQARLVIVGAGPEEDRLRQLAPQDGRVEFLGAVEDQQLVSLYQHARALIFTPINEDLGLVALEAMACAKPVLTCHDSGEPALMVEHGMTGLVAKPSARSIANFLRRLWVEPELAKNLGQAAQKWVANITWERVADVLLAELSHRLERPARTAVAQETKLRILATDNQVLDPPVGGGRLRIFNLYRNFPSHWDLTYVGAFDCRGATFRDQRLGPNFREVLTPLTRRHLLLHRILGRFAKNVTIDVTLPILLNQTPRFGRLLREHGHGAQVIIVSHCWVWPEVKRLLRAKPQMRPLLVYDAHNVEFLIKKQIISRSPVGRFLVRKVREVEGDLCAHADLIFSCSSADTGKFQDLYGVPAHKLVLIRNGVMPDEIPPRTEALHALARAGLGLSRDWAAVFVGSPYPPNVDGVRFIVDTLAPELPEMDFLILGGAGEMFKNEAGSRDLPANVRLLGQVAAEQRNVIYYAADFGLNPMCRGSGTNIKMFDYLAAGLPVIATPVGARGIDGQAGEDFLVGSEPEFPNLLRGLIADPVRRAELGARGRDLVERKYDCRIIAAEAAEAIENAWQRHMGSCQRRAS